MKNPIPLTLPCLGNLESGGLETGGLESGSLETGSLESGGLETRPQPQISDRCLYSPVLVWESRVWGSRDWKSRVWKSRDWESRVWGSRDSTPATDFGSVLVLTCPGLGV